jgi:hypothetical protein
MCGSHVIETPSLGIPTGLVVFWEVGVPIEFYNEIRNVAKEAEEDALQYELFSSC